MTIDPRVGMYLNMIVGILTGLLGAAAMFTDLVGAQLSLKIIAGLGIALIVVNGVLHAIPSKPGATEQFPLGPKVIALIAILLTGFLVVGAGSARAADVVTKAPALSYSYPATKCGMYYGANVVGSAASVSNAAVGTQIVQGAIGLTLGYTCPTGPGYWFADADFDFANLNGSANGFNLSGPAMFTQRFGFGAPVDLLMGLIPGLSSLQSSMPSLIPLPTGVSVVTSFPYLFGAFHQDDIGNQSGLGSFKQFLISGGLGIGNKVRLSNGVVFDPSVEYILPSSKVCVGPAGLGCIREGSGLRVVSKLEF